MNAKHPLHDYERLTADSLRIERTLDAPIETVWRWLTEPELRRQWFAAGTPSAQVGEFVLVFDHDELSSGDVPYPPEFEKHRGAVSHERVLKSEPPHLLVWSWSGGKQGTVTFELSTQGDGTRLVLTHAGISGAPSYQSFSSGWLAHLTVLEAKIAGGSVADFWELIRQNKAALTAAS